GVLLGYLATGSFEDVRRIAAAGKRERRIDAEHSDHLPTGFESILRRAVCPHPDKRYQTADDLRADLKQYQPVIAGEYTAWTWKFLAVGLALMVVFSFARSLGLVSKPPSQSTVEWIRRHAIELTTTEAGHGFADLQRLEPLIGSARIVSLDETMLGS